MKEALVDIAVLLVFFTRPNQFKQVFEQVKKARPSKLFLYQDGPRDGRKDDIENIKKCREIAENIDWDCEVHKLYQEKNFGVDPSGYVADTWAFSQVDKCIVLEDDTVPAVSFFSFCKEMLDKYENNDRVMLVSGFNPEEETKNISSDYFFSTTTFTWGWASWARVVRQWDPSYAFLQDSNKRKQIENYIRKNGLVKNMLNVFQNHLDSGIEHFETILMSNQYLHEGLTIVPKKNMVQNIGITDEASHFAGNLDLLPKGYRRIFQNQKYEFDMKNVIHPKQIEDFPEYRRRTYRIYGWNHPLVKAYRQMEVLSYYLKYGKWQEMTKDVKNKLTKLKTRTYS